MSDYLPIHDHFYGYYSKNKQEINIELRQSIDNVGAYLNSLYDSPNLRKLGEYSSHTFEYPGSQSGTWDLKIEFDSTVGLNGTHNISFLIEYKTSLEESNVEQLIRQIKNRGIAPTPSGYYFVRFILTYDDRFEIYREVIENEDIVLCILPKDHIPEIKSKFCLEKSNSNQSGLGNYQKGDFE